MKLSELDLFFREASKGFVVAIFLNCLGKHAIIPHICELRSDENKTRAHGTYQSPE